MIFHTDKMEKFCEQMAHSLTKNQFEPYQANKLSESIKTTLEMKMDLILDRLNSKQQYMETI